MSKEFKISEVEGINLDANIITLVDKLNGMVGINTFSSCGGHEDDYNGRRCSTGDWFVNFTVDIILGGMMGLAYILQCSQKYDDIDIVVWLDGEDFDPLAIRYEMRGCGIKPAELADLL